MDNDDIFQEKFKTSLGVYGTSRIGSVNYANNVNNKAIERLALFKKSISRADEIEAISMFSYDNLPSNLTSKLLERIAYYRGRAMFYYDDVLEQYQFLPLALTSEDTDTIDFYGRYNCVKPMPFNGKSTKEQGAQAVYLGNITRKPVYGMEELSLIDSETFKKEHCVIFNAYSQGVNQWLESEAYLQRPWIDAQAELPTLIRTAILKATMPKLLKVADQGVVDAVNAEIRALEDSILQGKTIIPIASMFDVENLETTANVATTIDSLLKAFESYANMRTSFLGIESNGAFRKGAQQNDAETSTNNTATTLIYKDKLTCRQEFVDLVNKGFGLNIILKEEQDEQSLGNTDITRDLSEQG